MKLTRLRVSNFRNVKFADLPILGKRVFLFGENGQGKTNLLEAASLLTALRSFRTRDTKLLVKHGEKLTQVAFELEHEAEGPTKIMMSLGSNGQKTVEIGEGTAVKKLSDFVGRFPAVVFSSDDISFLRGSPAVRRRWIDVTFSALDQSYLMQLQRYYRALEARNKLLKSLHTTATQCTAFEKIMAESGDFLVKTRERGLAAAAEKFTELAGRILQADSSPQISYSPSIRLDGASAWEDFFEQTRRTDLLFHATQKGPHRDDLRFKIGGKDAVDFASEGQQRGMSLALGLVQLSMFRDHAGTAPIVLADDVLGELDPIRRENFWREIGDDLQVIATGTALPADVRGWEIFTVAAGTYSAFSGI